jgi:hypothetical protein
LAVALLVERWGNLEEERDVLKVLLREEGMALLLAMQRDAL